MHVNDVYKGKLAHQWLAGAGLSFTSRLILPSQQQIRFNKVQLACLNIIDSVTGGGVSFPEGPLFVRVDEIAPLCLQLCEGYNCGNVIGGFDTNQNSYIAIEPLMARPVMVKNPGVEDTLHGSVTYTILTAQGVSPSTASITPTTQFTVVLTFYTTHNMTTSC